jgi:WD40 repeat protein
MCKSQVLQWELPSGQLLATFPAPQGESFIGATRLSPDGQVLAVAGRTFAHNVPKTIQLWQLPEQRKLLQLHGHLDAIGGLAFSPDGRTLASSHENGVIRLWNVESGQERATLTGHMAEQISLAFTKDGRRLISADTSGEVRAWEADLPSDVPVPVKGGGR